MISMNDFAMEPSQLREEMLQAVKRVVDSGWYILGPELKAFEAQWASTCGFAEAVGVANGMDAIEIALRSLDIGPGDEVITTPMTAFATVLAVLRAGAIPVLADIDPTTGLMSLESAERCVSARTKAVLLVHLYGQLRQPERWVEFCQRHAIMLVEDCAQAHLANQNGVYAGTFGRAGAYSFYPTKNLGALGDAGMLVTADPELAERARQLRNYGQSVRYLHPELGMNSRLDEIHAAMLLVRLRWLESFTARRRVIAETYRQGLRNPLINLLREPETPGSHVHHLFVVLCEQRDKLASHLLAQGVQALIHYPVPIHHQAPCSDILRDPQGLPHSEGHAKTCLSLPCHPQLSYEDVTTVIEAVNSFRAA